MKQKDKSRKEAAQEFYKSLDSSTTLRHRVDLVVDFMKLEYVNGQTERVVFNHLRELIDPKDLPDIRCDIIEAVIKFRYYDKTDYKRLDKIGENGSPRETFWQNMGARYRVGKLLKLTDLYSTENWGLNIVAMKKVGVQIKYGNYRLEESDSDNGWFSRFSKESDSYKNHFPFFTKDQLERPLDADDIVRLAQGVLLDGDAEAIRHLLGKYPDYKTARNRLDDRAYALPTSDVSPNIVNQSGFSTRAKVVIAVVASMLVLWVIGVRSLSSDGGNPRDLQAEASSEVSTDEGSLSAGVGTVIDAPTSAAARASQQQREQYNNLSADQKAYVDDQMKQYDEFCSQRGDC